MTASRNLAAAGRLVASLALVFASACALDAGHGFGTMEDARLDARFEPGGRLDEDGAFLVLGGYRITPSVLTLDVSTVDLDELVTTGGGGGGAFDPANPPPGYTLCHGGHCHHEDGRLVDYEDIQAELSAGGGSEYVPMVSMLVDEELALLGEGSSQALTRFAPSRELPEGRISRTRVDVGRFVLEGTVTGGAFGEASYPLVLNVAIDGTLSSIEESREVSLDAAAAVRVGVGVPIDATFLDGQDLSAELSDGRVEIADGPTAEAVAAAILGTRLRVIME